MENFGNSPVSPEPSPLENLWKAVLVLACCGLFASLSFNVFLLKQKRGLILQREQFEEQVNSAQQMQNAVSNLVQEVAVFSLQHPDVRPILTRYGVTINFVPAPGTSPIPSGKAPPKPH